MLGLKSMARSDPARAASILRKLVTADIDYSAAEAFSRIYQSLKSSLASPTKKLAILGSFTTHQLAALIELYLFSHGINASVYESDYGVVQQEILDPASGLHAFAPDVIYLATHRRSLGAGPQATSPQMK